MNPIPLIASAIMFVVAFVSIRNPDGVRSWMRNRSIGILPAAVRESAESIAPVIFAIIGIFLGLGFLAAFVMPLLSQ